MIRWVTILTSLGLFLTRATIDSQREYIISGHYSGHSAGASCRLIKTIVRCKRWRQSGGAGVRCLRVCCLVLFWPLFYCRYCCCSSACVLRRTSLLSVVLCACDVAVVRRVCLRSPCHRRRQASRIVSDGGFVAAGRVNGTPLPPSLPLAVYYSLNPACVLVPQAC